MSTLESRELLIQQRQAEKYINVVRMTLLAILTVALLLQHGGFRGGTTWMGTVPPLMVLSAWLYAFAVHWSVSRGFFPRYLPWLTTLTDLVFLALGSYIELGALVPNSVTALTNLGWCYALLFLLILFSTLRERAELTLTNGLLCTGVYAGLVGLVIGQEATPALWTDQGFRMLFLLLAGFFSSFHARSIRKAFERAANSDRLRRETDARLKVLALHFPGVLFQAEVKGKDFHLRYVSEGSRELLGIDAMDLVRSPHLFFQRTEPNFREVLWARVDGDPERNRTWEVEFPYRYDQVSLWLKMSATTHQAIQGVVVVNGLVSDVTEQRKAAEALREANQAKTDFLATMSHELRTPLNAILGNADHLSRLADQEDDKKAFRDLQTSGETLLGLIEDILVFSRLEAGRLTPEIRPFAWKGQLEALLDTFQPMAKSKGLVLQWKAPLGAPTFLWTDALRLRQIVGNLVGNAIKFTPSGFVTVEVSFLPGDQSPWLVVQVSDTGIGIPTDHQSRIFEKFTQGEHGKSRTYGGLGLGLSISRSLSELLGGTLTVTSQPSQGSTFTLRIPVRTGEHLGEQSSMGTELDGGRRSARVLLVEDNLTNQDVATRMLKKLGVQVDLAPGGREAVDLATRKFYDLIFMDWQMPIMDGREATSRIRGLPGGQDLVIVALSGHALPGDRELLLASGFDDYLSKPVRMDDFRAMLAKWVKLPQDPN